MPFAIKAQILDPAAKLFEFQAAKTMYGGRHIGLGDTVYIFASENEGGSGLVVRGLVTAAAPVQKARGIGRQTPRVSVTILASASAKRRLGRAELKAFTEWTDGGAETELNFKLYRQATNKIVGISEHAATFLSTFF